MTIATGIASIWARDPVAAANGQRTLAEAFGDRFVLGLGVSHAAVVEDVLGRPYRAPYTAMREFLDRMQAAPFRSAEPQAPPRRLLAALGPRMLALGGARADGVHPYLTTVGHTKRAREILGPGPILAPEQMVTLETEPGAARAVARETLARYLGLPSYQGSVRRLGFDAADLVGGGSDRLVDALVAWGGEDAIRCRVRDHLQAGADHVVVQLLVAGTGQCAGGQLRRLSTALLPDR